MRRYRRFTDSSLSRCHHNYTSHNLYQLSVISYQLSAISYQLSVISYQFYRVFRFNAVNRYFYQSLNHCLLITVY
ncbi:MAG: hypothetical protein EWV80_15390 [Microcystis aeruginosa Ma_QC_B_20070730_S2]|uniref:Uncharacterized protein n=1 Tax=Microcystis aeruginosa Ma_QC_B_20070730_S2 TaxID=2486256 RepID=A0A552DHP3_MICAE|nr:MAG: hypothetical protein EWV80_15390 [Microcystis aeruginosa Ma_QC_B_20070730_S2]